MPVRRCLACRQAAPKPSLVRFVIVDGAARVDPLAREPGRGAYLCGRPVCTDAALRRNGAALRRALRATEAPVRVDVAGLRAACEGLAARGTGSEPTGVSE